MLPLSLLSNRDFPDTKAGKEYWKEATAAEVRKDFRRPGNKKILKYGSSIPNWGIISRSKVSSSNTDNSDINNNNMNNNDINKSSGVNHEQNSSVNNLDNTNDYNTSDSHNSNIGDNSDNKTEYMDTNMTEYSDITTCLPQQTNNLILCNTNDKSNNSNSTSFKVIQNKSSSNSMYEIKNGNKSTKKCKTDVKNTNKNTENSSISEINKNNKNKNEIHEMSCDTVVAREEKYVNSFRLNSLIQSNLSQKEITGILHHGITYDSNKMRKNSYNNSNKNNNDKNNNNDDNNHNNKSNKKNNNHNTNNKKNNNNDNNENNEYLYQSFLSLMQAFTLQIPPSLPLQTMLYTLLTPCGKGVVTSGALIFAPTQHDYYNYLYYHDRRSDPSVSSTRLGNKRLGEWRGVNIDIDTDINTNTDLDVNVRKDVSTDIDINKDSIDNKQINTKKIIKNILLTNSLVKNGGRKTIGYVCSGRYIGSHNGALSIGLCDSSLLIDMQQTAAKKILYIANNNNNCNGIILNLVMFQSPRSKWLRAGLIDIVSSIY